MTYPFASLSSGLLARKGAAQPAMASHGGGNPLRMAIRSEAQPHAPIDDAFVATPAYRPQAPVRLNGYAPVEEAPAVAAPIVQVHRHPAATRLSGLIEEVSAPAAPAAPARPQAPPSSAVRFKGYAPEDDEPVHSDPAPAFRPQTVLARAGFVFESGPPPLPSAPQAETSPVVHSPRAAETGGGCGSSGNCNIADAVAVDPARRFHVSVRLKQSHFVRLKIASAVLRKPSQDIVSEALGMFFRSLNPDVFGDCACARDS